MIERFACGKYRDRYPDSPKLRLLLPLTFFVFSCSSFYPHLSAHKTQNIVCHDLMLKISVLLIIYWLTSAVQVVMASVRARQNPQFQNIAAVRFTVMRATANYNYCWSKNMWKLVFPI